MSLTTPEIATHPRLKACLRDQALMLLQLHGANPRAASTFATQQRWLLAHLAMAHYFEGLAGVVRPGFYSAPYLEAVVAHRIASANTASAFLKEMQHYGFVHTREHERDRRILVLEPVPAVVELISAWLAAHLATLDALDGSARLTWFGVHPQAIAAIQPLIASELLRSAPIRDPAPTFNLFTWLNDGGIVMDWLYAGLEPAADEAGRIATSVTQIADFNARISLSRTHLSRKLRAAEDLGSLGWTGKRGKSRMWVSATFAAEYEAQQAAKLAIIDVCFAHVAGEKAAAAPQAQFDLADAAPDAHAGEHPAPPADPVPVASGRAAESLDAKR